MTDLEELKKSTTYWNLGGSGEIRTHGCRKTSPVFKTGAIDHSATLPSGVFYPDRSPWRMYIDAMNTNYHHHRSDLVRIATRVMVERGLEPEFSARVEQQMASITGPASETSAQIHDLTALLWCSIDNDDSLDLDQLTVCEVLAQGAVRLWLAIADVDALVKKD